MWKALILLAKEQHTMDLEQTVQDLRTRIDRLRAQLDANNDEPTSIVVEQSEPITVVEPKQSAADVYKAKLMKKV